MTDAPETPRTENPLTGFLTADITGYATHPDGTTTGTPPTEEQK